MSDHIMISVPQQQEASKDGTLLQFYRDIFTATLGGLCANKDCGAMYPEQIVAKAFLIAEAAIEEIEKRRPES